MQQRLKLSFSRACSRVCGFVQYISALYTDEVPRIGCDRFTNRYVPAMDLLVKQLHTARVTSTIRGTTTPIRTMCHPKQYGTDHQLLRRGHCQINQTQRIRLQRAIIPCYRLSSGIRPCIGCKQQYPIRTSAHTGHVQIRHQKQRHCHLKQTIRFRACSMNC